MNDIDKAPQLDFSSGDIFMKVFIFATRFPNFMSPFIFTTSFKVLYALRYLSLLLLIRKQNRLAKQAEKIGMPVQYERTFIGLIVFRGLAKSPYYVSKCTSGELILDYLKTRGTVTLKNMCNSFKVFMKGEWKEWRAKVYSDELLHNLITHSIFGYYLVKSKREGFDYEAYCEAFDTEDFYPFERQEVRRIYIRLHDTKMLVIMNSGDEVTNGDKYWDIAKLAVQSALYQYNSVRGHNWTHFNYPDTVVAKTYSLISNKSTFFKLMHPHIRYVPMTNLNGASGRATARHIGPHLDSVRTDSFVPTSHPEHIFGIISRAITFCTGEDTPLGHDIYNTGLRLGFPHHGFKDSEVPYVKNLYTLYKIIREFVDIVYHEIPEEHLDIDLWKADILKLFPHINAEQVNTVDFIATFIWHSAILHSMDHATQAIYFEDRAAPSCFNKPFDSKQDMKLHEMYDPVKIAMGWAIVSGFVRFHPSDRFNDSMAGLDYGFINEKLISAQNEFKHKIEKELALNWVFNFEQDNKKIEVTMSDLSTSISF